MKDNSYKYSKYDSDSHNCLDTEAPNNATVIHTFSSKLCLPQIHQTDIRKSHKADMDKQSLTASKHYACISYDAMSLTAVAETRYQFLTGWLPKRAKKHNKAV